MSRKHSSLLIRFLRDPSRELAHALAVFTHALAQLLPLALAVVACAIVALVARIVLSRVRDARLARGARLLELAVPPEPDPDGALLLWSSLHDLLRPRVARLLGGQPQLAWELAADERGSRFRIWIPAAVPPGLVERALASAWPGITLVGLTATVADATHTATEADAE
ncbi:MAG: hypothetical protein JWN10_1992 [Solirubrobacterales bacterium]|nr:hypothetical protein [Solirubrobacterales bacterium]